MNILEIKDVTYNYSNSREKVLSKMHKTLEAMRSGATEAREKEVLPLFEKSRPYYEKAYELKPDEPDYKYALRNIYYNLNDAEKLKAIEGQ